MKNLTDRSANTFCNLNKTDKQIIPKKGRILKIKQGYNPNSSSIGSLVFILPNMLLTVGVVFGAVSGLLISKFLKASDTEQADLDNADKKNTSL
jgi:hypothetical protein